MLILHSYIPKILCVINQLVSALLYTIDTHYETLVLTSTD
jgi:hypothetical protein